MLKKNIQIPVIDITKQQSSYNFNSKILKYFLLDQKRFIVSILWIFTFINSDIERDKNIILNDWIYLRFNTMTDLDPFFYEAYFFGGKYLSVIKDNPIAAEKLMKKGIKYFPNKFWLNFHRGINALFDLKDKKIALESFKKMNQHKLIKKYILYKSMFLKLLYSSDHFQAFKAEIKPTNNPRLKRLYYMLKTKMDLKCLNSKKPIGCDKNDYFGKKYIKKGDKYYPPNDLKMKMSL